VIDTASCGNGCCSAQFTVDKKPQEVSYSVQAYLKSGGVDGLFGLVGAADAIAYQGWYSILQGTHTTFIKKYNDTLNFAIRPLPQGGSMVRVFSISDIMGAIGDAGQNHRTVTLLGSALDLGPMTILFGCGAAPSYPVLLDTSVELARKFEPSLHRAIAWMERGLCAFVGGALVVLFSYLRKPRGQPSDEYFLAA
jgi:hypothetical protein